MFPRSGLAAILLIFAVTAASPAASAQPSDSLRERIRQTVTSRDAAVCGQVDLPDEAFIAFDPFWEDAPALLTDFAKARCRDHPDHYATADGAPVEIWQARAAEPKLVFSRRVKAFRVRDGLLATDEAGGQCGPHGPAACRGAYAWIQSPPSIDADDMYPADFSLAEEEAAAASPFGQAVRAAVIGENRDCHGLQLPPWSITPVGDLTGDGQPELIFDLGALRCDHEVSRGFSTGGNLREVWTNDGGRLHRLLAVHLIAARAEGGLLVTQQHPVICDAPGGAQYCEVTYAYDLARRKLAVRSKVLRPDPAP